MRPFAAWCGGGAVDARNETTGCENVSEIEPTRRNGGQASGGSVGGNPNTPPRRETANAIHSPSGYRAGWVRRRHSASPKLSHPEVIRSRIPEAALRDCWYPRGRSAGPATPPWRIGGYRGRQGTCNEDRQDVLPARQRMSFLAPPSPERQSSSSQTEQKYCLPPQCARPGRNTYTALVPVPRHPNGNMGAFPNQVRKKPPLDPSPSDGIFQDPAAALPVYRNHLIATLPEIGRRI
jgi:hypothetical protein